MGKDFINICIRKWRWFVASVVTLLVLAIMFLLVVPPKYERQATVLIKDETSGGGLLSSMMGNMGMLAGMAGINIQSNVLNEMEIIKSPGMLSKVIDRMGLEVRYQAYDGLMKRDLWQETLPIKVSFPQIGKDEAAYMKMDLRKDGTYTLYKLRKNGKKVSGEATGKVGEVCQTPLGKVSIIKTKDFDKSFTEDNEMTIRITKERRYDIIDRMQKQLDIELSDDQTSIIRISYRDQSEEKAEVLINTLINVYQEDWFNNKQTEADASTRFINERIASIEEELSGLDTNIAQFRGRNLLPDYEEAAKMYLKNATITYEQQVKVNNYLYMLEQMRDEVKKIDGKNIVLPANLLPDNPNVALEIQEYNKLQTKRNTMVENSSEENPLVKDLDLQLKGMRGAIINSIDQGVAQLKAQQKGVGREDQKLKGEMAVAPEKITKILPAERKQKIIEALYIYLLEKREENNITHVFNTQNMRLISPPMGDWKPIFPKKGVTLITALAIGVLLPLLTVFLMVNIRRVLKEE
ncbi:Chain length determinant protein [Xylanibacter ruminicola]|uniref:Chain length determinant protein n=1 Tax=Xylanibacter ruminicola TaxID=839 RepID=A0A1H5S9H5_XYLRU|nr:Wzz/FepE/Etk N-terminal domain-containing protein [Xylanibacter ruminicola]SEF47084.1 Chain length determinant protein [Xylanibacter ruminicola]